MSLEKLNMFFAGKGDPPRVPVRTYSYSDDAYFDSIKQYENEPWFDRLKENPWLFSRQGKFSPTLLNQISEIFGDYSAEVNYYNTLLSNQQQWLSDTLSMYHQQDYDSAVEQNNRMSAAGINSALAGGVTPGSAAENDQPIMQNPQLGNSDESLARLSSFMLNLYSFASGFAKDVIGLQQMSNDLASSEISSNLNLPKLAQDYILGSISEPNLVDGHWNFPDLSLDKLKSYADTNFRSRLARRKFVKEVQSSYSSARDKYARFGLLTNLEDARGALANSIGKNLSYGWSGDNNFDPMVVVTKHINSMARQLLELQQNYDSKYLHSVDANLAAEAVNANNQLSKDTAESLSYQRQMDKVINQSMNSLIQDLSVVAKSNSLDGAIAKGMLLFVSAYRLQMIPSLPKVDLKGFITNENKTFNKFSISE